MRDFRMRIMMIIFYVIMVALGVTFAALNATDVNINLYVSTFTMPVSVLVIVTLGIGTLFGFCLILYRYWRLKSDYRKIKNQLKLTEKEIKNLRAIPLQDQH